MAKFIVKNRPTCLGKFAVTCKLSWSGGKVASGDPESPTVPLSPIHGLCV